MLIQRGQWRKYRMKLCQFVLFLLKQVMIQYISNYTPHHSENRSELFISLKFFLKGNIVKFQQIAWITTILNLIMHSQISLIFIRDSTFCILFKSICNGFNIIVENIIFFN